MGTWFCLFLDRDNDILVPGSGNDWQMELENPYIFSYQTSVVYEFTCPGCNSGYTSAKLTAAYTPELRNIHITQNLKSINTSLLTCMRTV
jgi:hypothetical protein